MESDHFLVIPEENNKTRQLMINIFRSSIILSKVTLSREKVKKSMWKEVIKLQNFANQIKYNSINFNSKFDIDKNTSNVHFFSHCYSFNNQNEKEAFIDKSSSLLYFSYRSNFPPLINESNNNYKDSIITSNIYTSDCGWGCMIRSSQIILSRALYKIFKRKYPSKKGNVLLQCLFYFFDFPCDYIQLPESYLSILTQYNLNIRYRDKDINGDNKDKSEIESVIPPFSLKAICAVGKLFNKHAGDWFSDYHLPQIFSLINKEFDVISDLSIMHFQGFVNKSIVINECFTEIKSIANTYIKDNITFLDKTYSYCKSGLIFISTRLGLDKISPDYYDSIKEVFNCKLFIGFIGGKGGMAYYFFGYNIDHLLYLDPHFNQKAGQKINEELLNSYLPKKIYQLKFDKLQTCLTFAFLFRDVREYNILFDWLSKYSRSVNPCFTVVDKVDIDKLNKDDFINSDKDDF